MFLCLFLIWLFGSRNAFYKRCPWKRNLNLQSESISGKSIFITFVPFYVYSSCENRFKCCNSACIVCHNFSRITESWLILIIVRFCSFMFIEISVMFNVSLMLIRCSHSSAFSSFLPIQTSQNFVKTKSSLLAWMHSLIWANRLI